MQSDNALTNEKLTKKFSSLFDLVAHAIKIARYTVKTGREPKVRSGIKNPAYLTLKEIEEGKDHDVFTQKLPVKTEYRSERSGDYTKQVMMSEGE
jgi:hypothetical protein